MRYGKVSRWCACLAGGVLLLAQQGCRDYDSATAGITAPLPPRQSPTSAPAFDVGGFRLIPRAEYSIQAKLLSKRAYRHGRLTPLSPWDFALGWAEMSDDAVLRHVSFTQGDRFLFRHALLRNLSMEYIEHTTANVHIVPATDRLAHALGRVPSGATVTLDGKLVDVIDGRSHKLIATSLTRTDSGAGACEILFVESLAVVPDAGSGQQSEAAGDRVATSVGYDSVIVAAAVHAR